MRLFLLTTLTMVAFAANSIFNRVAVDTGTIDAGPFAVIRVLSGAVALLVPALLLETWTFEPSWTLAIAFSYTVLIPGLAATVVWFLLVRRIGTVRAATFHFLNPFLGVAIAALFLGERLGALDILGVTIVTLAILAVQVSRVSDDP